MSTLSIKGANIALKLTEMGHCVMIAASAAKERQKSDMGPTHAASFPERTLAKKNVRLRPTAACFFLIRWTAFISGIPHAPVLPAGR